MAKTSRRTKTKAAETSFRRQAQKTARRERSIQRKIDRRDKRRGKAHKEKGAMQAAARRYPEPKLPAHHLSKPGREADLELAPMYKAPFYRGSEKLQNIALVTEGVPESVARWPCCLRARAQTWRLPI